MSKKKRSSIARGETALERTVQIAHGVSIADVSTKNLVKRTINLMLLSGLDGRPRVAAALHVGGLNALHDPAYSGALRAADIVYADGIAAVAVARAAGATQIERSPTTDIGVPILKEAASVLSRPVRVAAIGGPEGLAAQALDTLHQSCPIERVFSATGFNDDPDWTRILEELRESRPDVLIIGMGAQKELLFVMHNRISLPGCLVLTCGGWFGFIVGNERRASRTQQALGLEWVSRWLQSPGRLTTRYSRGIFTTARYVVRALMARRS